MITVDLIASEDIHEALEISLRELGSDYLSSVDFEEMVEPTDGFCMIAHNDGKVAGFAICKEFGPEEVDERLRLPHSQERMMLLSKKKIGLLDSVAVSSDARGLGIGRKMCETCMARFKEDGAEIVTAMACEDVKGHTNIDHILRNTLTMAPSYALIGYWNQFVDSPNGHNCPICGPPCKCYGRLYYKLL